MKILSSGDWHVNLHKKKVSYDWQLNRFISLFDKLRKLEEECDVHVISGDLFDKKPEIDEVCLLLAYLNAVTIPTIVIPGNHEATKKGHSFWEHFKLENTVTNKNVFISTNNERIEILGQGFQTFPYGSVQTDNLPKYVDGDILVTHIRGEVPPHISAEYDFEKLKQWKLVLIADLHFNHKYKNYPIYYPGSPLNTTFDRDDKREYGVDIVDFYNIDDYTVNFVDLKLPKLIRKTINFGEELIKDPYNNVIYEVVGAIDDIAKLEKSELLDKKIVNTVKNSSLLDLDNKTEYEELEMYLDYMQVSNKNAVLDMYKKIGIA